MTTHSPTESQIIRAPELRVRAAIVLTEQITRLDQLAGTLPQARVTLGFSSENGLPPSHQAALPEIASRLDLAQAALKLLAKACDGLWYDDGPIRLLEAQS